MAAGDLIVPEHRLSELCQRYGIARLFIFGSLAKGEATEGSDIDLLYELAPGASIGWEIIDLEDELSGIFGRPVDLVSRKYLHPLLRGEVEATMRELYAA